jgi:hypothetical protein
LLDTGTANLSATISGEEIQHLPSFNRDVFQLAQLAPGAFGDASQGSGGGSYELPGNQGPGGSAGSSAGIFQTENGPQIQTRGGQYETNSISIDGISTVSAVWGGTSVITPSEDSVQDVKIVTNSYDAEVGRFSGGQIQVTSKSGTNDLHGSAFFKVSRPGLNAYQRWNGLGSDVPGTPASRGLNRDESRFNNYGGSLGGPFWKNRVFGFFNYETSPYSSSGTAQGWYETSQFDQAAASGSIASKYLTYKGEGVASGATLIQRTCSQVGLQEGVNCATTTGGLDLGSPLKSALGTQDPTYGGSTNAPGVGGGLDGVPDVGFFNTSIRRALHRLSTTAAWTRIYGRMTILPSPFTGCRSPQLTTKVPFGPPTSGTIRRSTMRSRSSGTTPSRPLCSTRRAPTQRAGVGMKSPPIRRNHSACLRTTSATSTIVRAEDRPVPLARRTFNTSAPPDRLI